MKQKGQSALAIPTVLVVAAWLAVACAIGSAPGSATLSASAAPTPAAATTAASPTPLAAIVMPSPSQSAITTPDLPSADPGNGAPPLGSLSAGTQPNEQVRGWLGPHCWQNACLDGGPMPGASKLPVLAVRAGGQVTFYIEPVSGVFNTWHVAYQSATGTPVPLASGDPSDPDAGQTEPPMREYVTFSSPPAGDWTMTMSLRFAAGGDAVYAWHVIVK